MRYFCPSAIFDYLGGQLGDKMGDNLQISKLNTYSGAYPFSIPGLQSEVRSAKIGSF